MKILITENQLRFITESELLNEALSLDTARIFQRYVRSFQSESDISRLFNKLKQSKDYVGQSKRGDRIYFNYDNPIKNTNDIAPSGTFEVIKGLLKDIDVELNLTDYVNGIGKLPDGRGVKIPKLLDILFKKKYDNSIDNHNKQILLNSYLNDKIREKPKPSLIVISRANYDIAGMSTGRGWTSCMNLDGGSNKGYISCDLEEGSIIAYLIKKEDLNINNPIARVMIKPYINRYNEYNTIFRQDNTVYGTATKSFVESVSKLLEDSQDMSSVYDLNSRLYNDNHSRTFVGKQLSQQNKLNKVAYLIRNGDPLDDELFDLASDDMKRRYLQSAIYQQYLTDDQFFYASDEQKKIYIEHGYVHDGNSYDFLTDEQREWLEQNRHLF